MANTHAVSSKALALILKDRRKALGINQTTTGERVGVKQDTVSAFENNPDGTKLATLFKLLSSLDLELHIVPKNTPLIKNFDEDDELW